MLSDIRETVQKSEVYSCGVVLVEMLTGLRVIDINRPPAQYNLVK
jgi:hypothetical protein